MDDWQWWNPSVPAKLRELHATGHRLVIFSNQFLIGRGVLGGVSQRVRGLVNQVVASLNDGGEVPVQVLCATTEDSPHCMPGKGMWDFFVSELNAGVKPGEV